MNFNVSMLGKRVVVTLAYEEDEGEKDVIAVGKLLSFTDYGEAVVLDDGGVVAHCWPALNFEVIGD